MTSDEQTMLPLTVQVFPPPTVDSRARAAGWKRNRFKEHPVSDAPMSRTSAATVPFGAQNHAEPPEPLRSFVEWFYEQREVRERFRWALRDSLDELLDGQRTGRWCYQHLSKTEKTYLGTAVEVNLTKEFEIESGLDLDWSIAGADIDCKFSRDLGGWEIPMEMYRCADHGDRSGKADHVALLTWFNDDQGEWAAGLIQITDENLRWNRSGTGRAYNRDNKRKLSAAALRDIYWLWGGVQDDLPTNLLLHLPDQQRSRILRGSSGQRRVNQLFREVRGRVINRHTVLTVAQQDDSPKRARDARIHLRPEGIVVLGHQDTHPQIAERLGLTAPIKGEWISARLVPVDHLDERPKVWLECEWWAVARADDPVVPAPEIKGRTLPPPPS
ncbi:NaeI family type II restriction endonuclease [Amycolatopsis methanolica]|uniref:NaeI family type II restriction endonuclease n=1 Tax=Amycolatopsis methanolica TaxID=1814 RepID=UPI00341CEF0C